MTAIETKTHTLRFTNRDPLIRAINNGLLFAGADNFLPALTTIRFEFDGNQLLTVATDRYRLCVEAVELKARDENEPTVEPFNFLLQRADAKAALAVLKGTHRAEPIELDWEPETGVVRLRTGYSGNASQWRADVDHAFPAYRTLIPDPEDRKAVDEIGFTPAFLADLGKVQTGRGKGDMVRIGLYGSKKPTRIDYLEGPTVLLMPIRVDNTDAEAAEGGWGAGV